MSSTTKIFSEPDSWNASAALGDSLEHRLQRCQVAGNRFPGDRVVGEHDRHCRPLLDADDVDGQLIRVATVAVHSYVRTG
ncbi:Uncharacterised protein [Mycobacterium tuberculosis]|nr:Uncharacterised protein [Mycobacterium tuberculosis]